MEKEFEMEKGFEQGQELVLREPAVVYGKTKFTSQEYLEIERVSLERHEFYKGEIFHMYGHGEMLAMSGAAYNHNEIFTNLFGELCSKLKGGSCKPYGPDKRLHIPQNTLYTYPDIAVYCHQQSVSGDEDNSIDPSLIIEILSPSTRQYDMGAKFELYKDIPVLKEYILVEPKSLTIYCYRKGPGNSWQKEVYTGPSAVLTLQSMNITITLQDIYAGTGLV
jgi:Uma2 family endonuclease